MVFTRFVLHFLVIFLLSKQAIADTCMQFAESPLEKVYCEVKKEGLGTALPDFEDFKKNNESVQRLLLKRDASRLGITLPKVSKSLKAKKSPKVEKQPQSKKVSSNSDLEKKTQEAAKPAENIVDNIVEEVQVEDSLDQCSIQSGAIYCDNLRFDFASNKKNSELKAGALSESNTLQLDSFRGNFSNTEEVGRYLYEAYIVYIDKMIEIGLAEVTMSYSKFYYTFTYSHEKGLSFTTRFKDMYEFLKKDKLTMAVSNRSGKVPSVSLNECSKVNESIIVCDQEGHNYLFISDH